MIEVRIVVHSMNSAAQIHALNLKKRVQQADKALQSRLINCRCPLKCRIARHSVSLFLFFVCLPRVKQLGDGLLIGTVLDQWLSRFCHIQR